MQIRSIGSLNFNSKPKKQAVKSIKITPIQNNHIQNNQVQTNQNQNNSDNAQNANKKPTFRIYLSCSAPRTIALEENRGFLKSFYTPLDPSDEDKEISKDAE